MGGSVVGRWYSHPKRAKVPQTNYAVASTRRCTSEAKTAFGNGSAAWHSKSTTFQDCED